MVLDVLVITASNAAQARACRTQLRARARAGGLRGVRSWMVRSDPKGRRAGSGGATLAALWALARRFARREPGADLAALFSSRRVLILHSGGDSRRLPAYSAEGKLFAPLPIHPLDATPASLLDLVLDDLAPLVPLGSVLIASGDVHLNIGGLVPDLERVGSGVVACAARMPASAGARHGVFRIDAAGRVRDVRQKPSPEAARRAGAVDRAGRVLVDQGLVWLDAREAARWLAAAGAPASPRGEVPRGVLLDRIAAGRAGTIDLYTHLLMALASGLGPREYLRRVGAGVAATDALALRRGVRPGGLRALVVPRTDFLHVGSTRELLDHGRVIAGNSPREGLVVNSVVEAGSLRARDAWVESSRIDRPIRLRGRNVLVGWPGGKTLDLPPGVGLVCLPIDERAAAVVAFHERDDFKTPRGSGGTLAGMPIPPGFAGFGAEPVSGWTARAWRVGTFSRSLARARRVWLGDAGAEPGLVSLAELVTRVNHDRLIDRRWRLRARASAEGLGAAALSNPRLPADHAARAIVSRVDARRAAGSIARARAGAAPGDHLLHARLAWLGARVEARFSARWALLRREEALACVARAVAAGLEFPDHPPPAVRASASASAPARLDLFGGWSDTPPICHELGGSVVNAAVRVDGEHPIRASARVTDRPGITIRSIDGGHAASLRTTREAIRYDDPRDWAALPKAALVLAGVAPSDESVELRSWVEGVASPMDGRGIELEASSSLPKGSGLGTSSILGATILAALDRLFGRRFHSPTLIRRASLLEQMMSTGGGWQDQAGGILPGFKLLTTRPGPDQTPRARRLGFPAREEFAARTLLYYTGQRRMARGILHGVVGRFLGRDPEAIAVLTRLRDGAAGMADAIERGDIEALARGLCENWELKKAIDPGATNARIESLIASVQRWLSGYELPGAGGGGFILMIARDEHAASKVRRILAKGPGRFHDAAIDDEGMRSERSVRR